MENSLVPSIDHSGLTESQENRLNEIAGLEQHQQILDERALAAEAQGPDIAAQGGELIYTQEMTEDFFDALAEDAGGYLADQLANEWGSAASHNLSVVATLLSYGGPDIEDLWDGIPAHPAEFRVALAIAQGLGIQPASPGKKVSIGQPQQRQAPMANNGTLQMRLNELIKRQADAQASGDHELATALEPIIMETATAISGDEPIVGGFSPTHGNRTV